MRLPVVMVFITFVAGSAGPAVAQSGSGDSSRGFYLEAAGGANWLSDSDGFYRLRPDHPIPALQNREFPSTTDYDTGWGIAGRFGYAWTAGLRLDGEITYRRNQIDSTTFLATDGNNNFFRVFYT